MKLYIHTGAQGARVTGRKARRNPKTKAVTAIRRAMSAPDATITRHEAHQQLRYAQQYNARRTEESRAQDWVRLQADRVARELRAKPAPTPSKAATLSRAEKRASKATTCECTLHHTCAMHAQGE